VPTPPPSPSPKEFLADDYQAARRRLFDAIDRAGASVESTVHPERRGPNGEELAIDVVSMGPEAADAALVVVSGTHGVEGFAGSALQTQLLTRVANGDLVAPEGLRIVLVHALNPFGFAWVSRTNEDNVDLNRNFIDWSMPLPANQAYDELAPVLVPERWDAEAIEATTAELWAAAERLGVRELQRVITAGQYRHPDGIYFGGVGPAWSNRWLEAHAPGLVGGAGRVVVLDLHTGLGPAGHGELISVDGSDRPGHQRARAWWGDVRSQQDGDAVSTDLTGEWLSRIEHWWPQAEVTAATLEFGTVDTVQVLQALRAEAWLRTDRARRSGPAQSESESEIESGPELDGAGDRAILAELRAAFAPDDPVWAQRVTDRFTDVVDGTLRGLRGDRSPAG
jgi:hypothetical protein